MFKEKSSKKRIQNTNQIKDTATLDAKHQQKVADLSAKHTSLAKYLEERRMINIELTNCTARIKDYKDTGMVDIPEYDIEWTSNINMQDRLERLDQIIADLQSSKEEIEYYENTGRILFKYYDVIQNQDAVIPKTAVPMVTPTRRKNASVASPPTRSILDAFAGTSNTPPPISAVVPIADKSSLVEEYVALTDPTFIQHSEENGMGNCALCSTLMVCIQHEGVMICPECGYQDVLLVEQNRPLLRQVTKESTASYKRINHFREWCSQLQGKESTDIPETVFEQILQEIKKEKIIDKKKITYNKMREILKKLKINKYYEHINYIINRINGMPTPHFPQELEDKLCSMFKEIQGPFLNAVMRTAKERKNFLSYAYCLHQFFKILNIPEYLKYTTLLKSREKLYVQDQIFKSICEELNWPFYPTL